MRRRTSVLAGSLVIALALLVVAFFLPVPYVAITPGPTYDTLGTQNGKPLIEVSGHDTYPAKGQLRMVTVYVQGDPDHDLTLWQTITGWLGKNKAVVPKSVYFPPGQTQQQASEQSSEQMEQSRESAVVAAMNYLKVAPNGTQVTSVVKDGASDGVLKVGDIISAADDKAITSSTALQDFVQAKPIGTTIKVTFTRDGKKQTAQVTTKSSGGSDPKSVIGVMIMDAYPFDVQIQISSVGGPSAGMMFALGIVDKLTPDGITGGKVIAGTGTIDNDGKVGVIGGIEQKVSGAKHDGATVFLTPAGNCSAAKKAAPKGLKLVKVETLGQAMTYLDDLKAGKPVPGC